MTVTGTWARALRKVLQMARVSEGRLADEVGVSRMAMSRYLRATRRPDPPTIRRSNDIASRLIGVPEARDYLFALALRDGLLELQDDDIPFAALLQLMEGFDSYFERGAREAIASAVECADLEDRQVFALFVDLAAVRGKHILFRLAGAAPRSPSLDALLFVFRAHQAPLESYLRSDEEAKIRRVREFFDLWVDAVITSRFAEAPIEDRQRAIAVILKQFAGTVDEIAAAIRGANAFSSRGRVPAVRRKSDPDTLKATRKGSPK